MVILVFPGISAGKKSACSAVDPSSIPGPGRSPGEGISYPLQYSWASLVAQMVKNPPAMQGTWVQYLVREDSTWPRATQPMCHDYSEARAARGCALKPKKPTQ